jgi:NTE family protein
MAVPRPKTALVLAGGGMFGAIQVGMLKALSAADVTADLVVGSSVGAINGAFYAGAPTAAGVRQLETVWRDVSRRDVFPMTWRTLAGFARRRDFLISSDGIRKLAEQHLPYANLEQAILPIHVVTTDVLSGGPVILSSGNAIDAIVASSAIPAAFAPVRIDNRLLIDGAVTSNTPVKVAVELGARRLIVLPTGFACSLNAPPNGAIASALHALTLMIARQLVSELDSLADDIDYTILPTLCPLASSPYDFTRIGALIDASAKASSDWIASGGLNVRAVPDSLRAHSHHGAHA